MLKVSKAMEAVLSCVKMSQMVKSGLKSMRKLKAAIS